VAAEAGLARTQLSATLKRLHQVTEGLAVGVIEAHQDAVGFQHLAAHFFLGDILTGQVLQAVHGNPRLVDDVEHLIETHGMQQPGDVRVAGHQGGQQAHLLPREDRQLGQQPEGRAVDTLRFDQVDDDAGEVRRGKDLFDCGIQHRAQCQADLADELEYKRTLLLGKLDLAITHSRFLLRTRRAMSSGISPSSLNPNALRSPVSVPPASAIRRGRAASFSLSASPGKRSRMPSESSVRLKVSGSCSSWFSKVASSNSPTGSPRPCRYSPRPS